MVQSPCFVGVSKPSDLPEFKDSYCRLIVFQKHHFESSLTNEVYVHGTFTTLTLDLHSMSQ